MCYPRFYMYNFAYLPNEVNQLTCTFGALEAVAPLPARPHQIPKNHHHHHNCCNNYYYYRQYHHYHYNYDGYKHINTTTSQHTSFALLLFLSLLPFLSLRPSITFTQYGILSLQISISRGMRG